MQSYITTVLVDIYYAQACISVFVWKFIITSNKNTVN